VKSTDSTLLHLRFGDYLKAGSSLGNLSRKYYENIITKNHEISFNPIYVMSDDVSLARQFLGNLHNLEFVFIERDPLISNFDYLRLFGAARRIICANSTYSWWGAFLAEDPQLVIAPHPWYVSKTNQDRILSSFYPDNFKQEISIWD